MATRSSCVSWFECSPRRPRRPADHWWAGFSLETREGVRLHVEPPRAGIAMPEGGRGVRYRWSFDFSYEPSNFARITRVVQNAAR